MRASRRHPNRHLVAIAVGSLLAALGATPASAANCTWNPASGNWGTAADWSCGVVPGINDDATVALSKVVTIDTAQSIRNLSNAGGVNIDAFQLTLSGSGNTTNTGTLNVGGAGPATLNVNAGHDITNAGGVINIADGSVLNQFGSKLIGGTINTTGTGRVVASNNGNNFLSGVTLNGRLDQSSTSQMRVSNGLTLNGNVDIGNNSTFAPVGNQTIGGTGTIAFADASGSNRLAVDTGNLTLGSGITVRGGNGRIGDQVYAGGASTLTNQGLISADVAGRSIVVTVNGSVINQGTMRAQNGGTLQIDPMSGGLNNSAGTLLADNGSVVLFNGLAVTGGALNSAGSGVFRAANSGFNYLNGVTLNGTLDMASATSIERVSVGGMVLNGTIHIGNNSILAPQGDQTISGTGSIIFADASGSNRLNVEAGNLTLGPGTTVRGGNGRIGDQSFVGGAATLTNNGTIQADVAGRSITITVNGTTTNNGTLAALNGGTLNLDSSIVGGAGSQIVAGAGSVVAQNGVTISGNMNLTGAGSFRPSNSASNFLSGVTLSGTLDMASATGQERVTGGLTLNNATVNIGLNSILAPQGNQTIGGTGTINFADNSGSNRLNVEAGNLTLGSGITVRGGNGRIGDQSHVGGPATLTNQGVISADVAGRSIIVTVNGSVINQGTMKAQDGGTLRIDYMSAGLDNSAGTLLAGNDGVVLFNGVAVSGGTLNSAGSGVFRADNNANNFLNGVTLNGKLDMASATSIERISAGGMVLNGTIQIGNNSILAPQGDQTISGTGSIVFADGSGSNRLNVEAGNLTLGSGITVSGGNGRIGDQSYVGGAATLTNQGLISADVAGRSIIVTVNGSVINQGTMKAQDGGTLRIDAMSGGLNNGAGTLLAGNDGVVLFNGVAVTGGTLNSAGSGVFRADNNGNNFLNGVTLNGTLDMASATSIERISAGGMALNGTINIGKNSILAPQGNQTISGTGSIIFADASGSNRLNVEAGNLTIGAGVTIRGQTGDIGGQSYVGGPATLTNNGTINADAGGTISINVNGSLTNNGTLRAQNGAMLVQDNLSGTGTLRVDPTGSMTLANGGHTQGRLLMGAAGSAINIGNGNLTINNDYTNDAAGTGNSFNRRAGVTGTGQIVAGGNVAQVITGAGVTGGNTTNATLTLGNVRVGANTFNYQIGNAGTTGPTLRGAIQTSVNGGNLTDARLSGSGVTASNYNAGAPGGNSGDLSVVFTAATAGVLAPLSGQVLNLRSNFENIADQKLNIVLAGGAAAYNAAVGAATPSPAVVANQRVGGTNTVALTVSNKAPAGAFSEDLRATFGANTGDAQNNGGMINALIAGGSNAGAMNVGVSTGSAGAKIGTVTLNYQTTGTVNGVSNGLPVAGANAPQTISVSGNVYQAAAGQIITAPLNFGTLQVGQQVSQSLVVRNTATGASGFVEDLNANFGASGNAQISGSGSLSGILAGQDSTASNGSMTVTVTGQTAGALNSAIRVDFFSAGAVNGVGNGLGTLAVGGEDYGVSGLIQAGGQVVNQASPLVNTPTINLGAARVGGAFGTSAVSVTNVATVAPQAALNASIAPNSGPVTAGGSFDLLLPGATDATSLIVGMNAGTAGNFTGANAGKATISFVSDASNVGGCQPNCQLPLAPQTVNVEGKVYTAAVGQTPTVTLDFGVVRVGDTPSAKNIVINNSAATTALNDTLRAELNGVSGPFTGNGGSVAGIGAQGSGTIAVGLDAAAAGVYSQSGTVSFMSQNPDMADVSAGPNTNVQLLAQVNNLANADFDWLSGAGVLTQNGADYVLDMGTVTVGTSLSALLQLDNDVAGPADDLSGDFELSGVNDFTLNGWDAFGGPTALAAGQAKGGLQLNWLAAAVGLYTDSIVFNGLGTNASDPRGLAQARTLLIKANVVQGGTQVPEPGTFALLLAAVAAGWAVRLQAGVGSLWRRAATRH